MHIIGVSYKQEYFNIDPSSRKKRSVSPTLEIGVPISMGSYTITLIGIKTIIYTDSNGLLN